MKYVDQYTCLAKADPKYTFLIYSPMSPSYLHYVDLPTGEAERWACPWSPGQAVLRSYLCDRVKAGYLGAGYQHSDPINVRTPH